MPGTYIQSIGQFCFRVILYSKDKNKRYFVGRIKKDILVSELVVTPFSMILDF